MSRIDQGAGAVPVADGAQVGGKLQKTADARPRGVQPPAARAVLVLPAARPRVRARCSRTPTGTQYSVLAQAPAPNPDAGRARRRAGSRTSTSTRPTRSATGDASLRITLSDLLLQTIDDNNSLAAWECPPSGTCDPLRTVVRFHARAYAASAGGDFFDAGGVAYLEGHQHSWRPGAATSADSPGPLWGEDAASTSTATPTTAARARPA